MTKSIIMEVCFFYSFTAYEQAGLQTPRLGLMSRLAFHGCYITALCSGNGSLREWLASVRQCSLTAVP